MTSSSSQPLCLVTGASGYVASHVVKKLIEQGYRVRGTVRSLSDPQKTSHLRQLFPTLELVEADLLKEGSFDKAVEGVTYVFHTASPFQPVVEDPQRDLVDPALKGTKNVLNSIKNHAADTVKRVVVTSSVAAVAGKRPEGHEYTEEDWNLDSRLDHEPYRYSKRLAEEAAWEWAKETGISLVVINPSFILGPPLSSRVDSYSVDLVKGFLEGRFKEFGAKNACFGCVDVRDVAEAHVKAATLPLSGPQEGGRYIVSSDRGIPHLQLAQTLARNGFEAYPLPTHEESPVTYIPRFSNKKAREQLGIVFTPLDTTLKDMANALLDLGVVPRR